jgi:DNA-directed RNA polymerase specialized sigma24 family protein
MYAPVSTPLAFSPSVPDPTWAGARCEQRQPVLFVNLVRNHHQAIFHLAHALLRDEVAAEKITQQVFSRARRHLDRGPGFVVEWIYYSSFRFVRMYHWRSVGLIARRRMTATVAGIHPRLDLNTFVRVIAQQPGKLDRHDCELLALRHVLGMSLGNIAQLLRMHPYEVANRLAWALERVNKLSRQPATEVMKTADLALSA